jgi:hypothetical protein
MKQQITKLLRYSERATFYPNYIMLVLLQDGPWYTCSVPVDQALAPRTYGRRSRTGVSKQENLNFITY